MDRATVQPGMLPLETDVLRPQQYAMIALAKLTAAILGTTTVVNGFTISAASPANMTVIVGPGEIYQLESLEATAWSSLPADTAHQIMKQGILLDPVALTLGAPQTIGYSQFYLVQVEYDDLDGQQILRPYYNAANPSVGWQGPGGNQQPDNTVRRGAVSIQAKAGVAGTSPTIPAPDPGYVGLFVVQVSYGQTTITSGNITAYTGAPFIPVTLPGVPNGVQSSEWTFCADQGTSGHLVATLSPAPLSQPDGMCIQVKAAHGAAGNDDIVVNSVGPYPIKKRANGGAPSIGDWSTGDILVLRKVGSSWQISGLLPSDVQTPSNPSSVPTYGAANSGGLVVASYNFGLNLDNLPLVSAYNPNDKVVLQTEESEDGLQSGVPYASRLSSFAAYIATLVSVSDGNTISGNGAPPSGVGNTGDWWEDWTNYRIYGPKQSAGWPSGYIQLALPPSPNSYAQFALASPQQITPNTHVIAKMTTVTGQAWCSVPNGVVTITQPGNYVFDCQIETGVGAASGDGTFAGGDLLINNVSLASIGSTNVSGPGNGYLPQNGGYLGQTLYLAAGSTAALRGYGDNDEFNSGYVGIQTATMNITKVG